PWAEVCLWWPNSLTASVLSSPALPRSNQTPSAPEKEAGSRPRIASMVDPCTRGLTHSHMSAAVALQAGLGELCALRPLLAVTHDLQAGFGDPVLAEDLDGAPCAAVAQTEVVFGRTALVAVAVDDDR